MVVIIDWRAQILKLFWARIYLPTELKSFILKHHYHLTPWDTPCVDLESIGKGIENRLILTDNVTKFLLIMFSLLLDHKTIETTMFQSILGIPRISSVV